MSMVQIHDAQGNPMAPRDGGAMLILARGAAPFEAADIYGEHLAAWEPPITPSDSELNPIVIASFHASAILFEMMVDVIECAVKQCEQPLQTKIEITDELLAGRYLPESI
jgi:hypothetical protein